MNQIQEILGQLQQLDIQLWVEEGRLLYDAPQEVMTPDIISQIKQQKSEIISFLQENSAQKIQPILPLARDEHLPLSFAQERLWFIDKFEGPTPVYNLYRILKLKGKLNIKALERAIAHLGQRHESLRTNFQEHEGKPYISIESEANFSLPLIDIENVAPTEQEIEIEKLIKKEISTAFNLEKDRLVKFSLLKLAPEKHILIIVIHHIITDGWSMGILTRELSTLYQAYHQNISPTLAPLPIQYVDFASWQRQYFSEKILSSQLNYWQEALGSIPPTLSLPLDRPRPQIQTFKGATITSSFTPDLTRQLKVLSQENKVTLFITLLSAFSVLLFRYSNQQDLIIGTPIANRNRQDIEGLIGFFVNSLPLRINLDGNLTFTELLQQVKTTALGAYEHQDLPFEKLVQELKVERNLSHNPLFQVLFAFQNIPDVTFNLEGLEVELLKSQRQTAKFDLSLFMREKGEQLKCLWEYKTDLFNSDTIERMQGHFQTLVAAIVSNPYQKISLLPLLRETEKQQILVDWNNTQADYPRHKCLHQLFEEQVQKTSDAVAVVFEEQQLTYQQLNEKANQLAHYLQKLGVTPETKIGICVKRSLEMIVGLLGIIKAGGAYVPVDPNYPLERMAFILEDAGIDLVLTQKSLIAQLPSTIKTILCLDEENFGQDQEKKNPTAEITSSNLIYIMYTSGSTGKPKGVEITHGNVINVLSSITNHLQVSAQDILLSLATFSFDISVAEIFLPLITGGKLIVPSEGRIKDAEKLIAIINQTKATIIDATPATWKLLQTANWQARQPLKIISTGEKLSSELANYLLTQSKSVWNIYGPTECTIWCLIHPLKKQEKVLIGKPLGNTQAYILDQSQQPVPIGVTGELHIGGEGLARGYLNRPQLTAEKFRDNPFGEGRIYKTGDLARYLADGQIEYLGRIDHQVKIRGFRIELGEIEAVLKENQAVKDTVVTIKEDITGEQRLIAYVIPSSNQSLTQKELRSFLRQKLPEYMIPNVFVTLETFPLTANGKVDLRSLPIPDSVRDIEEINFVAPRDQLEQKLVQIWEKFLGIHPISIHDNFFDIGGHSLLTVRLVAEIEKTLHQKLPIAALFQLTTVAQVADVIRQSDSQLRPQTSDLTTNDDDTADNNGKSSSWPELPLEDYRALLTTHAHWKSPRLGTKSLVLETQAGNPQQKLPILAVGGMGDLHHYLPSDQPVYSLPVHTHVKSHQIYIKALASCYVEEILSIQPQGPYILFGYCFGGTVALEIAQQLQAQGREIALLFLVERPSFDPVYKYYLKIMRPLISNWRQLLQRNLPEQKTYLIQKSKNLLNKILSKFKKQVQSSSSQSPNSKTNSIDNFKVNQNYEITYTKDIHLAQKNYVPEPYRGRVALYFSHEGARTSWLYPRAGWGKLMKGEVEVEIIPGSTNGLLIEPNVKILAKKLEDKGVKGLTSVGFLQKQ